MEESQSTTTQSNSNEHTLVASESHPGSTSGTVYVPVTEQREQSISIDDKLAVTISGLDGVISSLTFENRQISGDNVTIPATVVRKADIELGEQYTFEFEKVTEDLEDSEFAIADEEAGVSEPEADDIEVESESEVESEEEEEEGLGQLFG